MEMKIQNDKKKEVLTKAIITCLNCGFKKKETMPTDVSIMSF